MVTSSSSSSMRKLLLGLGFWVQGLRCFPWMGVNFFLKDGLKVDPSTLQILQNSANLPMVAKPFYGVLSDSLYINGEHRVPYIAAGALLQAISWLAIGLVSSPSFLTIVLYLLLGNLGASIVEVANDAIVAEAKPPGKKNSGELQSFVWVACSVGGVLGNLLGGASIDRTSPQTMFLAFGLILVVQFLVSISIHETSLDLPKSRSNPGIKKQLVELRWALRKPEISKSIIWFAASYATIPALTGTMFYYQTEHLQIESSVLGISKVFGQGTMLLWGVAYNRYFKSFSPRKLIVSIQTTMAVLMISDILFVRGVYQELGLSDSVYVVIFSGLLEVLYFFKILPFTVLMARLCPPGVEGSIMAFVASAIALAFIVSGYLGVAVASLAGVTGDDFSGLPIALLIQAVCTVLPLYWAACVAGEVKPATKRKQN